MIHVLLSPQAIHAIKFWCKKKAMHIHLSAGAIQHTYTQTHTCISTHIQTNTQDLHESHAADTSELGPC